ncbi:MAG: (Fe-S)-binding protein [Thermodesulfobacteriota bacterium]
MDSADQSFAQKFDLWGCYQCGKCTGGCPVSLKSRLNIRRLMIEGILGKNLDRINEKVELWDCTTCKTCTLRCPRGLKPMDLVIGMRGTLVEEGHIPKTIMEAMESVYKHGNPWGKPKNKRAEWLKNLPEGIKVKDFSQGDRAKYLYFTGCTASFDPRIQEVVKALVFCLRQAEVDFGILGNKEQCCGNEIRRMGEAGLFEVLAEENIKSFESYQIEHLFTTCPHGFNVLKNEYPQGKLDVLHTTQLLGKCLEEGKLRFKREIKKSVTYHDPCFLGKQNGVFDEPRILLHAIPGLTFKELDRSRERSLCCEGGGGRMWVEASSDAGKRLAEIRVHDAVELGAEILATACPFCVLTLEDAVKTSGHEEKIHVMDITELLAEAL